MKPPVVLVSGDEQIPGTKSVWLSVGRSEVTPGLVCSNFMERDFEGGAPYDTTRILGAIGQLAGHMLYYAILNGMDRDGQEAAWAYIRQAAEFKIDHIMSGDGNVVRHGGGAEPCAS